MGTTFSISHRQAHGLRRTLIPILVALSLLASQLPFLGALSADADPFQNSKPFEIDGNATTNAPATHIDWDTVVGAGYTFDPVDSQQDVTFTGGSAENSLTQDWSFTRSKATPRKSDLARTFAAGGLVGDSPLLYFGFELHDPGQQPSFSGNMEFNQSSASRTYPVAGGGSISLPIRTPGDILVAGEFTPNTTTLSVYQWTAGGWAVAAGAVSGAISPDTTISLPGTIGGGQAGPRRFVEASVDLGQVFGDMGCRSFAQAYAKGRTTGANAFDGTLVDVTDAIPVNIDFCGEVSLRKVDASNPNTGLAGAELALYEGTDTSGTPIFTCTTGADGYCTDTAGLAGLEPGTYTAVEVSPPPGYKLVSPYEQEFVLAPFGSEAIVFANPPITYAIDVDPEDDTNAVGYTHDFEVTLTTDYLDPDTTDDDPVLPLAGETVALAWTDGPADSGIRNVRDADGTTADEDPLLTSTTCVTDANGSCTVTVLSNSVGGPGTLTATYDTPFEGAAASDPAHSTAGTTAGSITDAGAKSWIGYRAELSADADNPLGEDHAFTATVYEVAADGSESLTDDEVTVTFDWDGPAGSALGSNSCVTGGDGTCSVTVTSPTAAGTGTINIASVAGEIVAGEDLVLEYADDEVTADKTWWDYRVSIDGDSTNPVGDEHTFVVTVERNDGSGWQHVPNGTTLDLEWDSDIDSEITDDGCSTGGTNDGVCEVTVTTTEKGEGTLTVTGIAGTTLGDYLDGAAFEFDTEDVSATKLWVDWEASISFPAQNPVGEAHTFTVAAQVWDGSAYVDVPDGTTVGLDLSASDLSQITVVEDTCAAGTSGGTCTLTVTAASPIVLDVTVASIDDTVIDDGGEDRNVSYSFADPETSSKEWIAYRIVGDDDATNLVGDDHVFTLRAQQLRESGNGIWEHLEGVTLDVALEAGGVGTLDAGTCATGTAADGTCTVTVSSAVPGRATVVATGIDGIELLDGETLTSTTTWDVDVDEAAQTKTWVRYDVTLSGDAVNNVGDDHDFTVDVTVDDGSGPLPATGATVNGVFELTSPATAPVDVDCTTDAAGSCTITIAAPADGGEAIAGVGTLTLTTLEHDYTGAGPDESFDVDLTGTLGLPTQFEQPSSVKQWIDYTLVVTPPTAVNLLPIEPEHTFTVTLGSSDAVTAPIAGQEVDLVLDTTVASIVAIVDGSGSTTYGPEDAQPTSCTTTATGTCEVTVATTGPGTADLTATFATTIGDANFELGDTGEKLWTTYRVGVTPVQAQNLLGTPHTFTVLVEQSDGDGWYEVEGAQPALSVTDPAFMVEGSNTCATGTAADGTCTVQIDSPVTGAFTLTAIYEGFVGQRSALFSDSGEKSWIDYLVTVTPETAENLVGTDHVFTVLVQIDTGEGFVAVPGAVPTLELGGPGSITSTDCGDGTADDGTCSVTISSATPGLSTLTATYLGTAGIGDGGVLESAEFSDSGDKLWVDYALDVDPDEAINALDDPHTFTVTLTRDEGAGHQPATGQSVDLTLTGPGSITAVAAGSVAEDGRSGTCTTGAAGTCSVTINSSDVGTSVLNASYLAEVGETSATFTDSGTKQWAAISLEKTALVEEGDDGLKVVTFDPTADEPLVFEYEYLITNTGPVALTVTSLEDDVLGTITLPEPLVLQPGESATATASHTVTEEDADAGEIVNVAVVTGEAEDGTEVTASDDEEVLVQTVLAGAPAIGLIKTALVDTDGQGNRVVEIDAGETATVTYRYRITNLGDVTLADLSLVDDKIGGITLPVTSLEPGESITVDADYTLTAADIAAGSVENIAIVTGTDPTGTEVDATDDEVVEIVEVLVVVERPEVPVEVKPAVLQRTLPRTGVEGDRLLALGVLLASLGAAALLFTPRRRRAD